MRETVLVVKEGVDCIPGKPIRDVLAARGFAAGFDTVFPFVESGIPAKFIKSRFDEKTIRELLALKIYDLPEDKIQGLIPLLCDKKLEELKEAVQKLRNKE